jgi:hypothetical protein
MAPLTKMPILLARCIWLRLGAIDLAAKSASLALIVESSFLSGAAMAAAKYRYLPTRLLLRYHDYQSATTIEKIASLILIAH